MREAPVVVLAVAGAGLAKNCDDAVPDNRLGLNGSYDSDVEAGAKTAAGAGDGTANGSYEAVAGARAGAKLLLLNDALLLLKELLNELLLLLAAAKGS